MKHWLAAILAALVVVIGGTAIASVPNGSSGDFNVADPAVTVISSGQTPGVGGVSEACSFSKEALTYCAPSASMTFTPVVDGTCQVSFDIALYGNPMGKEANRLNSVAYGVGAVIEGTPTEVDENGVTTTPTNISEQTVSRTRLVPVEAGVSYQFEPWIRSYAAANGSGYWDLAYTCFG